MDTVVPATGIGLVCIWTQYVSPVGARYWCSSVCPVPTVLATALSKSFPTPRTHELFTIVTSDAAGAPVAALLLPTAPIAPDPFVPEMFTPAKLMTVIDEITL
jgi:hypothetical protein